MFNNTENNLISRKEFNNDICVETQFEEIVSDYRRQDIVTQDSSADTIIFKTNFGDSLLFKLESTYNNIYSNLKRIQTLIQRLRLGRFSEELYDCFGYELQELLKNIDETANNTESNGIKLLNGQRKNIILPNKHNGNNADDNNFVSLGEEVFGDFEIKSTTLLGEDWNENATDYIFKNYETALSDINSALDYINSKLNAIKVCRNQLNQKTVHNPIKNNNRKEESVNLIDIQIELMNNAKKSVSTVVNKKLTYDIMLSIL